MWRYLCALLALLTLAAPAAADDSALNKEGFWTVGRGAADAKGCLASLHVQGGAMLILQVTSGQVDVAVGMQTAMRRGRTASLRIDADTFDFEPAYNDRRDLLYFDDSDARAFAALRAARSVAVQVDGAELLSVSVENTGLTAALDAVTACSKGESGWWGPGVGAKRPAPARNKENVWFLERSDLAGVCTAYALADERTLLVLLAGGGEIGVAIRSDDNLRRGKKGLVEADSTAIAFKPVFDGAKYFASDQPFDDSALAAVRNAKALRVSVDGRAAADVSVEGTGLPNLLDDLAACSKGQAGWWGEGAKTVAPKVAR